MNKLIPYRSYLFIIVILIASLVAFYILDRINSKKTNWQFDGNQAFEYAKYQVLLGPRIPGSLAHDQEIEWLRENLSQFNWDVEIQELIVEGHDIKNIIAKKELSVR